MALVEEGYKTRITVQAHSVILLFTSCFIFPYLQAACRGTFRMADHYLLTYREVIAHKNICRTFAIFCCRNVYKSLR